MINTYSNIYFKPYTSRTAGNIHEYALQNKKKEYNMIYDVHAAGTQND